MGQRPGVDELFMDIPEVTGTPLPERTPTRVERGAGGAQRRRSCCSGEDPFGQWWVVNRSRHLFA